MQEDAKYNPLCKDALPPDPELLAWEKWIQIRKNETEHLAKKTGRSPVDLTMNTLERLREDKERKIVLEHAQIEKKAVLRNRLWDQPERLKQKCYCDPVYEVQRTKAERGRPGVIEHIGVPQIIQETEKGLTGISRQKPCYCLNLDATYIQYRKKRENELQHRIKKIDPYRPEISNLIVTGTKPKIVLKRNVVIPTVKISPPSYLFEYKQSEIYALQINKSIFYKTLPGQDTTHLRKMQKKSSHVSCTSWSYYFNTSINKVGRAKLLLKNLGTVSLRYCWKENKIPITFIPDNYDEQVFFFNKNDDIIYPGQEKLVYFTFVSNKPDIYNESWEINFLDVCFFETDDKFIVNFTADATENVKVIKRKRNLLKRTIKFSALKTMARSIMEEIITKAISIEHQIYPYKNFFVEAEIFEMKNPVVFYHQTNVGNLKQLYTEMVPGELWNLSIMSWRQAMMTLEFNHRMKYYELLRKSHRELVKPWFEGEELLEQKYKAVNIILGQLADKFYDEYMNLIVAFSFYDKESVKTSTPESNTAGQSTELINKLVYPARDIFYMRMYDHIATTVDTCAGILSSLDINRWIHFDFCRK